MAPRSKTAAHWHDGKDWYGDTAFINAVQRVYPGGRLDHLGFGEFVLKTPDGEMEFDRMRGKEFPGQSGRSHKLYDNAGGKVVEKAIQLMERANKSERVAARKRGSEVTPSLRSKLIRLAHAKPELRSQLLPLLQKTAAPLILDDLGLDVRAARSGMGAMLWAVYPPGHPKATGPKGNSKFYEMLIVEAPGGYKLIRAWGALTDKGSGSLKGRKETVYMGLAKAKSELAKHYKIRLKRGYHDAYDPAQHKGPDGRKLPSGRYPIGLHRPGLGFGHGTQEMASCTPALRDVQKKLVESQQELFSGSYKEALWYLRRAEAVSKRGLGWSDSEMAKKIQDNIAHMIKRGVAVIESEDNRAAKVWRTALSRLVNYIDKQLSLCH